MKKSLLILVFILIHSVISFADDTEFKEDTSYSVVNNPLLQVMNDAEKEITAKIKSDRKEKNHIDIALKDVAKNTETKAPKKEELAQLVEEVEQLKTKVVFAKQNALATKDPRGRKKVGAITYYNYREGNIYELHAGVDRITDIALEPLEVLTSAPVAGDTVRWKIGNIESGTGTSKRTHIIVKPLEEGIETNILITTNKRTYHIRAISSDWYMPQIAWNYPEEEFKKIQAQKYKAALQETLTIAPYELRFRYRIKGGHYPWRPIRVFDDGRKTYLQMSKELEAREAPALFILDDGSEPRLTNYRVKGDYYIVDGLFSRAELRVGKSKSVKILSDDYRPSLFERIF